MLNKTTLNFLQHFIDYDQLEGVSCRDPSLGLPETIWSLVKIIITFVIPFVIISKFFSKFKMNNLM